MRYANRRAQKRVVAVTVAAGLVVVPLTGAAAVALVSPSESVNEEALVANSIAYAEGLQESTPQIVAEEGDVVLFSAPEISVKENPRPRARSVARSTATAEGGAVQVSNDYTPNNDIAQAVAGGSVIEIAKTQIGAPYVGGGKSPSTGFDCSGFVSWVYAQLGIDLPASSGAYYNVGVRVTDPKPGDIIVSPGHVGIYVGDGLQIDAPRPGKTIQVRKIWQKNPVYVRVA